MAYAQSIVTDWDLAEDVYQNAAIVALRKSDQLKSQDGILWWILKIARYEALKAVEARSKRKPIFGSEMIDVLDSEWKDYLASDRSSLVSQALEHCIKKLSARNQELVRLRYSEGLSGESLANALGKSLNTCYVALSRVHKQLRTCIQTRLARTSR